MKAAWVFSISLIFCSPFLVSAEPKCLIQNGDVNSDGQANLTDAVVLLQFLFLGGDPPKPQYVSDVECVNQLREELAVTKTDLEQSQQALAAAQAETAAANAALSECQGYWRPAEADIARARRRLPNGIPTGGNEASAAAVAGGASPRAPTTWRVFERNVMTFRRSWSPPQE